MKESVAASRVNNLISFYNKGVYYYHADGLGSIMALTDVTEQVVQDYQYNSFGHLKDQKNRIKQPQDALSREALQ